MIKVQSFIKERMTLVPVEVELALWPGLPVIQFVGLPDQHLKESAMRIKSALKACGFEFPIAQQILVNLRPSHLKKTSRGLELAVAVAYLWETGQLKREEGSPSFYIYGELTLAGDVHEPEDLVWSSPSLSSVVLTGLPAKPQEQAAFHRRVVRTLKELSSPRSLPPHFAQEKLERPFELLHRSFSEPQARLLEILAVGEHSALLAGPAGSGKTTVAQTLSALLREPSPIDFANLKRIHASWGGELKWRPVVKPHHSTPLISMVGGGSSPFPGEISKAHGGVLILDELLEFSPAVQEALREPFEEGVMRVSRQGKMQIFPAKAQIIGTTNLCPCGEWTPKKSKEKKCRFSMQRCRAFGPRLSGPFVDRFDLLEFTDPLEDFKVKGMELWERVREAQEFSANRKSFPNSRLTWESASKDPGFHRVQKLQSFLQKGLSQRRKLALLRVSRTLADLDFSAEVRNHHWDQALQKCQIPFEQLKRWE